MHKNRHGRCSRIEINDSHFFPYIRNASLLPQIYSRGLLFIALFLFSPFYFNHRHVQILMTVTIAFEKPFPNDLMSTYFVARCHVGEIKNIKTAFLWFLLILNLHETSYDYFKVYIQNSIWISKWENIRCLDLGWMVGWSGKEALNVFA